MATIITKNSQTPSAVPSAASLSVGELAVNTADGKLYTEHTGGVVKEIIPSTVSDGGITTAKIADGAITSAKIADGTIATADLANNSVTIAKLSATGTPSSSTFLRGDGSWVAVGGTEAQGGRGQYFTSSGTFTIPTGVTAIKVTALGGGGGGGGIISGGYCYSGASGGQGGTAVAYLTGLTPGNTLTVTIGGGGAGGYNGSTGGTTSLSSGTQTITTVSGLGGGGATGQVNGNGGGGGTGGTTNAAFASINIFSTAGRGNGGGGCFSCTSCNGSSGTAGALLIEW